MPRLGMNPSRGKKSDYKPARTTVAVLTFAPNAIGYFQNRFDVTKACIESILKNTQTPFDLMVFDNGSRDEVVEYLQSQKNCGNIDFLVLSNKNIGKMGALKFISKAAPGEVIAYCDDDVFFLPGWLKAHLRVLDTYPDVGVVTGFYIKSHMKYSVSATLSFASQEKIDTEKGNLIDPKQEAHYIRQMGRTQERYDSEIAGVEDLLIRYKGVSAFASAGHHQFVTIKQVLQDALPKQWRGNLMGQMRELDESINNLGKLRLCTYPDTTWLLGNQVDEKTEAMIQSHGIDIEASKKLDKAAPWKIRLMRNPLTQKIAYFFYERLFKIINA